MDAINPINARRSNQTARGCFAGSGIFSERKLYYCTVSIALGHSLDTGDQVYSCKPRVISNKCSRSRGKSTPPQASDPVSLNALSEQCGSTGTLHLKGCLESVNRSKYHSKSRSTLVPLVFPSNSQKDGNLAAYHKDTKMVLIGEGRSFKYEFDWSRARIPALAAVSPNLATGPTQLSLYTISNSE